MNFRVSQNGRNLVSTEPQKIVYRKEPSFLKGFLNCDGELLYEDR